MRILVVNSYHAKGGAAKAAFRLHESLRKIGIASTYISVYPENSRVASKLVYLFRVLVDRLPGLLAARNKILFSCEGPRNVRLIKNINNSDADVVHLHWMNAGALSLNDLAEINKPIMWTMHDNWLFTGGCHVMHDCVRYKRGCGQCPMLGSFGSSDLSRRNFEKKVQAFDARERVGLIAFVGVSNWITEAARQSALLGARKIIYLPNPIDTSLFVPTKKTKARARLGLPGNKKIILFGAHSAMKDKNKGYQFLVEALSGLPSLKDHLLLVFGGDSSFGTQTAIETRHLGYIKDSAELVDLYSAATVMIVPSVQESFGQTAAESMACGTPVVAFGATGLLDIVDHKLNGYLAEPFCTKSLAKGIEWILRSPDYDEICLAARRKIVDYFSAEVVAERYSQVYRQLKY